MARKTTTYRLMSAQGMHAPGIIAWLREVYVLDEKAAVKILRAGWRMPRIVAVGILSGVIPTHTDATDAVVAVVPK